MKKIRTFLLSLIMTLNVIMLSINVSAADDIVYDVDYSLWDKFIKYDLCITDYNSLSDEQKELCRFIFETEQKSGDTVICERARRTLAGDENIGERMTLDKLVDCYGIWDNYSVNKFGWSAYLHCVPDIKNMNGWDDYNEYWLDEEGKAKIIYAGENSGTDNTKGIFGVKVTSAEDLSEYEEFYIENEQMIPYYADSQNKDGTYNINFTMFRKGDEPMVVHTDGKYTFETDMYIESDGDYYYIKPDNTAVLVMSRYYNWQLAAEPVTEPFAVPSEINGCPVTTINKMAFFNAPLTEIVIPDSVTIINNRAFMGCDYLEKLKLPEGLEYLGKNAICMPNLKKLVINCPKLYLAADSLSGGFTEAEINVREIGENAFSSALLLESVKLGKDVEKIGANAFRYCSALKSVNIPENVIAIGQGAFCETSVKSVAVLPSAEIIGALSELKGKPATSGRDYPAIRPLTDEPVCVFDSDCVINGYAGTEAERYADEFGLAFNALEKTVITECDADGDGKVTVSDIIKIQKSLGRPKMSTVIYDMNDDGKFNVFDIVIAKRQFIESLKF